LADGVSKELEWKTGLAFNDFMIHPPPQEPGGNRWLVAFLRLRLRLSLPLGHKKSRHPARLPNTASTQRTP